MSDQRIDPDKRPDNNHDQQNLDAIRRFLAEPNNQAPRVGDPVHGGDPPLDKALNPRLFIDNKECMRCHPARDKELNFKLLDFGSFDRNRDLFAVGNKLVKDDPATREAREAERFKTEKPLEKVVHVFQRLPENASLTMNGKSGKLETDFAKVMEAIPGVKLDDRTRDVVSAVKSISFDGDKITVDLKKDTKLPINVEAGPLKLTDLQLGGGKSKFSCELELDAKDPKKIALKNIEGMSVGLGNGKSIAIRELAVTVENGKPTLNVTVDNPIPLLKPVTIPIALERLAPELGADMIRGTLGQIAGMRDLVQSRDFSKYLESIPDEGLRNKIGDMLKGITSMTKHGDTIEIMRNNGKTVHDMGGPQLSVGQRISFKVGGSPQNPQLKEINGIDFSVPLPSQLDLGDRFSTNLTGIGLGLEDSHGRRDLTIRTGNMIDSVKTRLTPNMTPETDGSGTWGADIWMKNPLSDNARDRLFVPLKIDSGGNLAMKSSDIANLVSRATYQASDFSPGGAVMYGTSVLSGDLGTVFRWFGK